MIPKIFLLLVLAAFWLGGNASMAQSPKKTIELLVYGSCEHCKDRIETALDIKGVSKVIYKPKTQWLKLTVDTTKISEDSVTAIIAGLGHDTERKKASDAAYNALPACCKYPRKK